MHVHSINNEKIILVLLSAALALIALLDFLSKNMSLLLPSTRIIPGRVIPDEIISFWSSTLNTNLMIGSIVLISIVFIFAMNTRPIKISISNYRLDILIPIIALLIGIYLWSLPEGNLDYYRYYVNANSINEIGLREYIKTWRPSGTDLPFISLIYGLLFNIFGVSRLVIQLFNTICFAFISYLTYRIGTEIWNHTVGLYASIISLISVPFILDVPLTLIDIPYVFLLLLFTYSLLLAYRSKFWQASALLTIILVPAVMLSKATAIIYIPIIFTSLTIIEAYRVNQRKKILFRSVIILACIFAIFAILLILYHHKLLLFYGNLRSRPSLDTGVVFPILQAISNLIIGAWSLRKPFGWIRNIFYLFGTIVAILSFYSIAYLVKKRDVRFVLLLGWIVIPIFFLPGGHRFDLVRYFFPSVPAFAIGSALIISKLKPKIRNVLLLSIVLSSLLTVSLIWIPRINATGMAAIQSSCDFVNSLEVDSVGLVHVAETEWGKKLTRKHVQGQLIIHFNYQLKHNLRYYEANRILSESDELPQILIVVSDTHNIPGSLESLTIFRYELVSVREGYLGGAWSPLICRIYSLKS